MTQKNCVSTKFEDNELKCNLQISSGNYLKCQKEMQSQMKGTKRQAGAVVRGEKNDCIQIQPLIQDPQQSTPDLGLSRCSWEGAQLCWTSNTASQGACGKALLLFDPVAHCPG